MRVGIDATCIDDSGPTGTGRYLSSLLYGLSILDTRNDRVIYGFEGSLKALPPGGERVVYRRVPMLRALGPAAREVSRQLFLRRQVYADRIDVLHCTLEGLLPGRGVPVVFTCFDAARLRPGSGGMDGVRNRLRTRLRNAMAQQAHRLIALTNHAKNDIASTIGIEPARIAVVPPAVDIMFFESCDESRIARTLDRLSIRRPYLLFVGETGRQKNETVALEALYRLIRGGHDVSLVLAGNLEIVPFRLQKALSDSELAARVVMCHRPDDLTLRDLYAGALALTFPSFAEGFGLPVAEAMACGCPCVVVRDSAPAEVAGEAGLTVDPENPGQIADVAARLLESYDLRDRFSQAARRRAQMFTVEAMVRGTLAVYEEAFESTR